MAKLASDISAATSLRPSAVGDFVTTVGSSAMSSRYTEIAKSVSTWRRDALPRTRRSKREAMQIWRNSMQVEANQTRSVQAQHVWSLNGAISHESYSRAKTGLHLHFG